jgi:hypothetical protein
MESIRFFDVPLSEIPLNIKELFLLMGYGSHVPGQDILNMVEEMLLDLRDRCKPHFGYMMQQWKIIDRARLGIAHAVLNTGRIITAAMREADQFILFTSTAGHEFDRWLKQTGQEDDIVKTFVANTLGSVIVESTVSLLMKKLAQAAANEGLHISNNYSPGYCDWLLSEQKILFSLFPPDITGIQLTDSCLMLPIKSVSGLVGIGRNVKKRPYGCEICKMATCVKNKKKININ